MDVDADSDKLSLNEIDEETDVLGDGDGLKLCESDGLLDGL